MSDDVGLELYKALLRSGRDPLVTAVAVRAPYSSLSAATAWTLALTLAWRHPEYFRAVVMDEAAEELLVEFGDIVDAYVEAHPVGGVYFREEPDE